MRYEIPPATCTILVSIAHCSCIVMSVSVECCLYLGCGAGEWGTSAVQLAGLHANKDSQERHQMGHTWWVHWWNRPKRYWLLSRLARNRSIVTVVDILPPTRDSHASLPSILVTTRASVLPWHTITILSGVTIHLNDRSGRGELSPYYEYISSPSSFVSYPLWNIFSAIKV